MKYTLAKVHAPAWRFWWWFVPRRRHALAMARTLMAGGLWPEESKLNASRYVVEVRASSLAS